MLEAVIIVGICAAGLLRSTLTGRAEQPQRTTLIETGTIAHFDPVTDILTITTADGAQQFTIGSKVRVREGRHKIDLSALATLVGRDIRVRYVESGGRRSVRSLTVAERSKKREKM